MTTVIERLGANLVRNGRVDNLDEWVAAIGGTGGVASLQRVTGTPPPGYSAYARSVVTTDPSSGTEYLDVRNTGAATNLVTPGTSYQLDALVRGNFNGDDVMYIQWLNAGGSVISTINTPNVAGSGSWTPTTPLIGVAPALSTRAQIIRRRIPTTVLAVNNYVDITGLTLRPSAVAGNLITPILVTGWETKREAGAFVHRIANSGINRATLAPASPRAGVMELLVEDATAAAVAEIRLATANVYRIEDDEVPEIAMTFVVSGGEITTQLDPETRVRYLVRVPFVEVSGA